MPSQETLLLSVSGMLTLNTFYDIMLYFEPVDHKFHISKCLSMQQRISVANLKGTNLGRHGENICR